MKKCIYQRKYHYDGKIFCKYTGSIRRQCNIGECKYFKPTLRLKLFGTERTSNK